MQQYKRIQLCVGFDESKHGYLNPCQNIINDEVKRKNETHYFQDYKAAQFYPTNPTVVDAGLCNILLTDGKNNEKVMRTEEDDVMEDLSLIHI